MSVYADDFPLFLDLTTVAPGCTCQHFHSWVLQHITAAFPNGFHKRHRVWRGMNNGHVGEECLMPFIAGVSLVDLFTLTLVDFHSVKLLCLCLQLILWKEIESRQDLNKYTKPSSSYEEQDIVFHSHTSSDAWIHYLLLLNEGPHWERYWRSRGRNAKEEEK